MASNLLISYHIHFQYLYNHLLPYILLQIIDKMWPDCLINQLKSALNRGSFLSKFWILLRRLPQVTSPTSPRWQRSRNRSSSTSPSWPGPWCFYEKPTPSDGPACTQTSRWVCPSSFNFSSTLYSFNCPISKSFLLFSPQTLPAFWETRSPPGTKVVQNKWVWIKSSNITQVPNDRSLWLIGLKKPTTRRKIHVRALLSLEQLTQDFQVY